MDKHDIILENLKKKVSYQIQERIICFLEGENKPINTAGTSLLGNYQDKLKNYSWLYFGLVRMFKPVWVNKEMDRQLSGLLQHHGEGAFILNLGSGPRIIKGRTDIINVDLFAFDSVDMIADAEDLPLDDESVDLILNQAMLEHVPNPEIVVREMHRLLRPGGDVFCYLPFIVPFHAAPHDYYRWTMTGVHHLFRQFDEIEVGVGAGPTSAMLWGVQEWLAILMSFGSRRLHDIIFLILMVLLSPIKMLDIFLVKHPYAKKIASGFYIKAKKRDKLQYH